MNDKNEVAAIRLVQENLPDVPVPRVYFASQVGCVKSYPFELRTSDSFYSFVAPLSSSKSAFRGLHSMLRTVTC